jgi:hypothetical protein
MKPYRPNVKQQKRLYSLRLMFERKRAGKPVSPIRIKSNSTPWIENPRTLADVKEISARIEATRETWNVFRECLFLGGEPSVETPERNRREATQYRQSG